MEVNGGFHALKSPQYSIEVRWAPELFWMLSRTQKSLVSGSVNILENHHNWQNKCLVRK
jgi:hypothetical protein